MKRQGKPVAADGSCPVFNRDRSSLEEEPAFCENCRAYDGGFCHMDELAAALPAAPAASSADGDRNAQNMREQTPMIYEGGQGGEYGKYFIQSLQCPDGMGTPEYQRMYANFSHRILWMDGNVVPGAFQMNTAWYYAVPERDPIFLEHSHAYSELLGFYGSNPDDPYELNGEILFTIAGEVHRMTRSTMIFLPPDLPHNPMRILRVDKPIFHFSIVPNSTYDGSGTYR